MRIKLLAVAAFVAMLAAPLGVYAQANQAPGARAYGHTNPSPAKLQHRWTRRFGRLNLSGDQQQRIQSIINQYSQAHPQGSPRDRGSARELRHQIMGVLSSDQQNQFRQEMQARRAQMRQRDGQMQQGGAQNYQGAPDQRYQQGPDQQPYQQGPPQQYQQGPPQQYQQGPPQQYQQGPPQQYQQGPPQQYQQGPPQQYEQGPPDQQYQQGPQTDEQPGSPPA